ncbi:MAG: hypothetical protein Q7T80_14115, partial [Methanoregula sp.]|nr:hypothetical protein [Methanoregula sp.]
MKQINSFVIVMICISCLVIPVSSESDENSLLIGVQNLSITVPPTQTGVQGSKEHMYGYQGWLNNCAIAISGYSNRLLVVFGMDEMDWYQDSSTSSSRLEPATMIPTLQEPEVVPTFGIPYSSELMTISTIRGGNGKQSVKIYIPASYWELWYTVEPEIMGGQDLGSYKGADSALFPSMSIIVTDIKNPDNVETIEPPGGLDKTLWQRSYDPRPWSQKFYRGCREYNFDVS